MTRNYVAWEVHDRSVQHSECMEYFKMHSDGEWKCATKVVLTKRRRVEANKKDMQVKGTIISHDRALCSFQQYHFKFFSYVLQLFSNLWSWNYESIRPFPVRIAVAKECRSRNQANRSWQNAWFNKNISIDVIIRRLVNFAQLPSFVRSLRC